MRLPAHIFLLGFVWLQVQSVVAAYMPAAQHASDCCGETGNADNDGCNGDREGAEAADSI
jgi:hypothetical protein